MEIREGSAASFIWIYLQRAPHHSVPAGDLLLGLGSRLSVGGGCPKSGKAAARRVGMGRRPAPDPQEEHAQVGVQAEPAGERRGNARAIGRGCCRDHSHRRLSAELSLGEGDCRGVWDVLARPPLEAGRDCQHRR